MLIQAATEAAKSSSRLVLDAPVIALIVTNVGLLGREFIRSRKAKKNGNGNSKGPGQAKICIERGEKIAVIEEKQKNFAGDITEIKTDIKTLLQRIPEKD